MNDKDLFIEKRDIVIYECMSALKSIDSDKIANYIDIVNEADKIFFVGVGRVLLSLKSICKRYAHLGIDSYIVGGITEPAITEGDVLIVGSGSGETAYPLEITKMAKKMGVTTIHIGSNPDGSIAKYIDLFIRIPVKSKLNHADEINSLQPMTSLFEQSLLLFGDITAMMIIENKNIELQELWKYHANLE